MCSARQLCEAGVVLLLAVLMAGACRSRTPEAKPVTPAAAETSYTPGSATGEATLLLMADIRGILRPCGCTVELQKGGFDRLAPFLEDQRERHPEAALLHAGPLFYERPAVEKSKVAQRKRQAEVTAELLARIDMDVPGATAVDLAAAGARYEKLVERARLGPTAANLEPRGGHDGDAPAPWVVRKVGDLRVGVFGLASPKHGDEASGAAAVGDPEEAARRAVEALKERADVVVLLSALGLREVKRLVRAVPGIHFVVAGGLGEHPVWSDEAEEVGGARVMQFHREGRYVGRLTIRMVDGEAEFVDASAPSEAELEVLRQRIDRLEASLEAWSETRDEEERSVRSARHRLASLREELQRLSGRDVEAPEGRSSFSFRQFPLDWDLPQDPEILAIMDAFDGELEAINLAHAGTLPEPGPDQATYVGVATCTGCHEETQAFWKADRHQEAWETLEEAGKTFDTECVHCHVTGYGEAGGSILGKTEGLEDVQCESCHGPGSKHVQSGGEAAFIDADPPEATCVTCHNQHHSPRFDFGSYREKLRVPGHGKPLEP